MYRRLFYEDRKFPKDSEISTPDDYIYPIGYKSLGHRFILVPVPFVP